MSRLKTLLLGLLRHLLGRQVVDRRPPGDNWPVLDVFRVGWLEAGRNLEPGERRRPAGNGRSLDLLPK